MADEQARLENIQSPSRFKRWRSRSVAILIPLLLISLTFLCFRSQPQLGLWTSHHFNLKGFGNRVRTLALASRQAASGVDAEKKLRIVICAKVATGIPYLLEWVEFHRLQGVDKFVLYHDAHASTPKTIEFALELELLGAIYRDVERRQQQAASGEPLINLIPEENTNYAESRYGSEEDLIELLPASFVAPDLNHIIKSRGGKTFATPNTHQSAIAGDCMQRYKDHAEYVMPMEVNEFVYSPTNDTLWDFLQSKKQQLQQDSSNPIVGFYIPGVDFGSSGMMWDFHNAWEMDYFGGRIDVYYDPRDSSLFRFLQQHKDAPSSSSQFAQQLDAFRTSKLAAFPPHSNKIPELVLFLQQQLSRDYPSTDAHPPAPFIDGLSIPGLDGKKSEQANDLNAFSNLIDSIFFQLQPAEKKQKQTDDTQTTTPPSSPAAPRPVNRYLDYIRRSSVFYPMVIEEQIRRGFADWETPNSDTIGNLLPVCKIPEADREQFLIENAGLTPKTKTLECTVQLYRDVCPTATNDRLLPTGRTIYMTEFLSSQSNLKDINELPGCFRPGAHTCSHQLAAGGKIKRLNPKAELRIDRHQFRSYEERASKLTQPNDGPSCYRNAVNFTALQQYLNSVVDTSKLRFAAKLRDRLPQFHVLPRFADYNLNTERTDNQISGFWIDRQKSLTKCTAIELLGDRRTMCPPDFPHVGYIMGPFTVPHPYEPYAWCSDTAIDYAKIDRGYPKITAEKVWNDAGLNPFQLFKKHTRTCRG